jgi:NADPH:quinone reductase-like Zn-dependent oxidoreductase
VAARGEGRIRVRSATVNAVGALQRGGPGSPDAEPPFVPGMDAAGVVDRTGPGTARICGSVTG